MTQEIQDDGKWSEIDIRKLTRDVRWSQWADVMRRKRESGQTVRTFCRENGIKEDRYYYWQRRLRMVVGTELCAHPHGTLPALPDTSDAPVFAQVPAVSGYAHADVVKMEASGITIEISPGADTGLAESILRLLLGRC